jgi:hypothetical protein
MRVTPSGKKEDEKTRDLIFLELPFAIKIL